jgi:homoaconitase/3-isopropylmalate dehydratase large subunit
VFNNLENGLEPPGNRGTVGNSWLSLVQHSDSLGTLGAWAHGIGSPEACMRSFRNQKMQDAPQCMVVSLYESQTRVLEAQEY